MRLSNYSITCKRLVWNTNVELSDVNFFSTVQPERVQTIDLKPYIISVGQITYSLDSTDEEDGKSNLFFETSDVNYELSGIVNNSFLKNYFGLFRDTTHEKYVIEIKEEFTRKLIHKGLVSQELIEEEFKPEPDSEIIKVTAHGFEKEFQNYFSGIEIPFTLSNWLGSGFPNVTFNDSYLKLYRPILGVLAELFPNIGFEVEINLLDWRIVLHPGIGRRAQNYGEGFNVCWLKSSYERIRAHGENRFDFLRRICNAMGWVFYWHNDKFFIKNRVPISDTAKLDFDNFMSYTLTKTANFLDYNYVMIIDGTTTGGDFTEGEDFWGPRLQVITNQDNCPYGRWWSHFNGNEWLTTFQITGWRIQWYAHEDDNVIYYNIREYIENGNNYGQNQLSMRQKDVLRIDAGDTGDECWAYNHLTGNSFPKTGHTTISPHEIAFSGCYGSAMYKLDGSNPHTYEDYVQTSTFRDNFQKFFRGNLSRKLTIKYNAVITNPLQKYTIINDTNNLFSGEWVTVSLKVDLVDEVTTLELQLKEADA